MSPHIKVIVNLIKHLVHCIFHSYVVGAEIIILHDTTPSVPVGALGPSSRPDTKASVPEMIPGSENLKK